MLRTSVEQSGINSWAQQQPAVKASMQTQIPKHATLGLCLEVFVPLNDRFQLQSWM